MLGGGAWGCGEIVAGTGVTPRARIGVEEREVLMIWVVLSCVPHFLNRHRSTTIIMINNAPTAPHMIAIVVK